MDTHKQDEALATKESKLLTDEIFSRAYGNMRNRLLANGFSASDSFTRTMTIEALKNDGYDIPNDAYDTYADLSKLVINSID